MSMTTLVVAIDGSEGTRPALELAFNVGRAHDACVQVLHAKADSRAAVPLLGEGMSGAMIEEMIAAAGREADARAVRARQMFEACCQTFEVPTGEGATASGGGFAAEWLEVEGREDELLALYARTNDLAVVGRPVSGSETPSQAVLSAALFEGGRGVLMAPPQPSALSLTGTVAVAWNGSVEAARAVAAALPFLKAAERVVILSADEAPAHPVASDQLLRYLSGHGVEASTAEFTPDGQALGEATLEECGKLAASLLVMGAYTHSRMRQLILGGVTSHVLAHAGIPVLMAH